MLRLAALLLVLPLAAAFCPQGAVQGTRPDTCYLYGSAQSWPDAEAYCASNKGHLSSVPNAFVNAFLISYPKALESAQSYWLGAELKNATDKWTWTDGSNFTYAKWAAEVAGGYPIVILGLKNSVLSPWSEKPSFNFLWDDGSFFDYSLFPDSSDETNWGDCAFFQREPEADEWLLMDCTEPTYTATAICQKSPKEA